MRNAITLWRYAGAGLLALVTMAGCSNQKVDDYVNEKPVLDLAEYLNGTLDAYGVFTDRSGKVVKRFSVVMTGSWSGSKGVLDERFSYSDGSVQTRVWHLEKQSDGQYVGRADDVVGVAKGQQRGNAFHWTYTMALPVGEKVYEVQFDDWMYLMSGKVMLNKATMSKWGLRLGEVTLSFIKR